MTPLRQRMTEDMELRGFSRHTQRAYVQYVAIFVRLVDIVSTAEVGCGLDGQRFALPTSPQRPQQQ
jgi:hypothetical protein